MVARCFEDIVAQRLSGNSATDAGRHTLSEEERLGRDGLRMSAGVDAPRQLFHTVGCQVCGKTGYAGRFAVHEVLNINEEIERMIVEHAHADDIKKAAVADGMLTLRQAGLNTRGVRDHFAGRGHARDLLARDRARPVRPAPVAALQVFLGH